MQFVAPRKEVSAYAFFCESKPVINSAATLLSAIRNARSTVKSKSGLSFSMHQLAGNQGSRKYLTKISYLQNYPACNDAASLLASVCPDASGTSSGRNVSYLQQDFTDNSPSFQNNNTGYTHGICYLIPEGVSGAATFPNQQAYVGSANPQRAGSASTTHLISLAFGSLSIQSIGIFSYAYTQSGFYVNYTMGMNIPANTAFYSVSATFGVTGQNRVSGYTTTGSGPRTHSQATAEADETVQIDNAFIPIRVSPLEIFLISLDRTDFTLGNALVPGNNYAGSFAREIYALPDKVFAM